MQFFNHPGCNTFFGAPAGWAEDPTNIPCHVLPAERTHIQGEKSTPCVVSYWRPTQEELAILLNGGHVALSILGQNMTPAMLYVEKEETEMQKMPLQHTKELKEIPMAMLLPHEKQAIMNHGQSLHRLAERGGLDATETLAILEGRGWNQTKVQPADEERLVALVQIWSAK